jgi:hypothetical protein
MTLEEFLTDIRAQVQSEIDERLKSPGASYPFKESVFSEIVMQHMAEIGMTFEPEACHVDTRIGNAPLRLSGYAISEDADQLDLFVSLFADLDTLGSVPDSETKNAAEQCLRFLANCAKGTVARAFDESHEAMPLATTIQESYASLEQIRIYVLTDRKAKSKNFKPKELGGKTIKLEVMDIERLYRHWSEGKPRDELVVNFEEVCGQALPCVYVPSTASDYDYALTVIPGEALRFIYERFGPRLLEANVRSFLSVTGKVNKGIRDTLRDNPERFMAYNNGIVVVADEGKFLQSSDGGVSLRWLQGMQIVNGGQTTASIYFAKRKSPEIDLSRVRVPAKVILLRSADAVGEEALIADISRFANSQNSVKQSDLSANKPFHVELEKLALTVYCPNGISRWFYERAAGSYNTMLVREGTTPAKLRNLKQTISPPAQRITKTDLAKFLNAWDQKPHLVSLGAQKNFEQMMDAIKLQEGDSPFVPDVIFFKTAIAKAILFKKAHTIVRPMFRSFQANITCYLVALLANRLGENFDFDRIWDRQDISGGLKAQLGAWATEVNDVLWKSAQGRMISEWAKKPECWSAVASASYSEPIAGVAEVRHP